MWRPNQGRDDVRYESRDGHSGLRSRRPSCRGYILRQGAGADGIMFSGSERCSATKISRTPCWKLWRKGETMKVNCLFLAIALLSTVLCAKEHFWFAAAIHARSSRGAETGREFEKDRIKVARCRRGLRIHTKLQVAIMSGKGARSGEARVSSSMSGAFASLNCRRPRSEELKGSFSFRTDRQSNIITPKDMTGS